MTRIFTAVVITIGLLSPVLADNDDHGRDGPRFDGPRFDGPRGAPAPLLGAGLPGLAMGVGYGAYWLARRRRNKS